MIILLIKSKGLRSKVIEMEKFEITSFNGSLSHEARKIIPNIFKGVTKAKRDYKNEMRTPIHNIKQAPKDLWEDIIKEAKSIGIDLIGFAPIDENLIFENDYVGGIEYLYENGIVLGMEMNYDAINTAPEPPAGLESFRIYAELGIATNKLTDFIRSKGFGAIGCHPLGGPVLYPAMAVKAKLGKIGKQGLLITKEFGPRQRLSMIAINAGPLPEIHNKDLKISEFCERCKRCIHLCPVNAILEEPNINEDGTITIPKALESYIN